MGEGDKHRIRRTARFDSRELARLSGKISPIAAAWDERVETAEGSDRLPISRTVTVDDPLTTSLLAEVTRRSKTVEISPEKLEEVKQQMEQSASDAAPAASIERDKADR